MAAWMVGADRLFRIREGDGKFARSASANNRRYAAIGSGTRIAVSWVRGTSSDTPLLKTGMSQTPDPLETVLNDYERRKQDETRRMVQRAFKLENARRKGAEHLRQFALPHSREVAEKLQEAGHHVVYQEFLDSYPPNVRLHLYPRPGAMDFDEPQRRTIEFVWGDPDPDRLVVRRWSSEGLGQLKEHASVPAVDVDELWVREQLLAFVRDALDLD
jgi:hypothetical protein